MGHGRRTILVTGGTGIIGGSLIPELVGRGASVRALVRGDALEPARHRLMERLAKNVAPPSVDPEAIRTCLGDTTRPSLGLDRGELAGVTDIVHCSGSTAFKDDEPGWSDNLLSARRVIALARSMHHAPRVIYVSTASVRIPHAGGTVREDDPFDGFTNGYIESKRAAEALYVAATDLDVLILRPSIVIGQGINDKRMARSLLWVIPAMAMLGDVPIDAHSRLDLVTVGFVAGSIARLAMRPTPRHRVLHVSAGPSASATCGEVVAALARRDLFVDQIRLHGAGPWPTSGRLTKLKAQVREAMDFYVPFLNADVVYARDRLDGILGAELPACPPVTDYVHRVLSLISKDEAIEESHRP